MISRAVNGASLAKLRALRIQAEAVTGSSDTSMQSASSAAVTLVRFLCCMFSLPFCVIYMLIADCKHTLVQTERAEVHRTAGNGPRTPAMYLILYQRILLV